MSEQDTIFIVMLFKLEFNIFLMKALYINISLISRFNTHTNVLNIYDLI